MLIRQKMHGDVTEMARHIAVSASADAISEHFARVGKKGRNFFPLSWAHADAATKTTHGEEREREMREREGERERESTFPAGVPLNYGP